MIEPCRWIHTVGMRFPIDVAYLDADGVVVKTIQMHRHRVGHSGRPRPIGDRSRGRCVRPLGSAGRRRRRGSRATRRAAVRRMSTLWLVATPIGNLGDLAPRAVDTLRHAKLICCEDTRRTGLLLQHAGIKARAARRVQRPHRSRPDRRRARGVGLRRRGGDRQRRRHPRNLRSGRADRAGRDRRRPHGERDPRTERGDHGGDDQRAADRPVRVRGIPAPQGSRTCRPDRRDRRRDPHVGDLRGAAPGAAHARRSARGVRG